MYDVGRQPLLLKGVHVKKCQNGFKLRHSEVHSADRIGHDPDGSFHSQMKDTNDTR